ncbi:MAG: hypothetical protein ACKVRP_09255 [Bacteroidota bacterium]
MMERLTEFFSSMTWPNVLISLGLFVVSLVFSTLVLGIVMVKLPADYFSASHPRHFLLDKPKFIRWGALIAKNLVGLFLIVMGIILSLPGVPGQGILTILLGLIMIDIPGKRPFEARIISRPPILNSINKLRARYGKPPLILD